MPFFGGEFFGGEFFSSQSVSEDLFRPSGGVPAYPDLVPFEQRDPYRRQVAAVIQKVAQAQVKTLRLDSQQRFEQLHRELQIEGLEFRADYLEALNVERNRLIDIEIGQRLREKLRKTADQEAMLLILLGAYLT